MENGASDEKKKRMRELCDVLNEAGRVYEQEDRELMPNIEYDRLYDELLALEKETGTVFTDSPTVNVGYEVSSSLPSEKHASPMLSLDKTKDREALAVWLGDREGVLSWKMDGLTVVLTYDNGNLEKAVTRGNGITGEVITPNARVFKNLPLTIPFKGRLVVRGESVIFYSDFERINREIADAGSRYKNPRNLCSGAVRQLNNEITAKRNVHFFAFSMVEAEGEEFSSRGAQLDRLAFLGFETVEYRIVTAATVSDEVESFERRVPSNDFPSDGLVLVFDDIQYGRSLGTTAKFPRDAIAFKWKDETALTKLKYIEWSASRTGQINPVAVFDPVELEGTTVSRASVHNVSILEELELGEGDEIEVYKANMIIPQIAENHTRSGNVQIPSACPVCGADTVIPDDTVKVLMCPNSECLAKNVKLMSLFVSRDALDIEGISESTIEKFVDLGYITQPADIFRLSEHRDEIVALEGFGERSYENLAAAAEKARRVEPARFLNGLGIEGIGSANAGIIARAAGHDFERMRELSVPELMEIDGIGEVLAKAYVDFFADEKKRAQVDELLKEVTFDVPSKPSGGEVLSGKTFVITGSLEHFENRKALEEYIKGYGGRAAGSVSSKTSYLISNDAGSGSSKTRKAVDLGVEIISEEEFIHMMDEALK